MKQKFVWAVGVGLVAFAVAGCGGSQTRELEARLAATTEQLARINQDLQKLHHVVQQKDIEFETATNSLQKAQTALQEKAAALEAANRTIQDKDQQLQQRSATPTYTYTPPPSTSKKKKGKKK